MGQKVHPYGFRLGYNKTWISNWYARKGYSEQLIEDMSLRKHIFKTLSHAGISKVEIERSANRVRINILAFTRKRAAGVFQKLLKSAIANAEENHKVLDVDDLVVKNVRVDEGVTWKRNMPRARGTSTMIQKKTSHITLILEEKEF